MTDLNKLSKAVSQNIQPNAPLALSANSTGEVTFSTARNTLAGFITKLKNLFGITSSNQRSAATALIDAVYEKAQANLGESTKSRTLAARVLASENVRANKAITANHVIQAEAKLELLTRAQNSIDSVLDLENSLDNPQSPLYRSVTSALREIKLKNQSIVSGDIGEWIETIEIASKSSDATVASFGSRPLHPTDQRKQIEILEEQHRIQVPVQGANYSRTPRVKELISPEAYAKFTAQVENGAARLLSQLEKETVSGGLVDSVAAKFEADLQIIVDTQVKHLFENVLFENLGSPYDSGIEFKYHVHGDKYQQVLAEIGGNDEEFNGTGFDDTEYNRLLSREVGYLTTVQGKSPGLEDIHLLSKKLLTSYRQKYVIDGGKYDDPLGANDAWHKKLLQLRASFKNDLTTCKSKTELKALQDRFTQQRVELGTECQLMRAQLPGSLHDLRFQHEFELPLKAEFDKRFTQLKNLANRAVDARN